MDALFTHDPDGRIRGIREPAGGLAPRLFFARTRENNLWRLRNDLDDGTVSVLETLAEREPVHGDLRAEPANVAGFRAALTHVPGPQPERCGPAYRFLEGIPPVAAVTRVTPENVRLVEAMGPSWRDFRLELPEREPCWAVIRDGMAVSVCFSARLTEHVAEAGVETAEGFRGKGYACSVVSAWANRVRAMGRIPLYSTEWENRASRAVARKLGLVQYAVDLSL